MSSSNSGVRSGDEHSTLELSSPADRGPWGIEIGAATGTRFYRLGRGDRLVLGSGASADLRIDDRAVSARHALLVASPTGVLVEDLSSRNGVYVGGARVGRAVLGSASCHLVVGRTSIILRPFAEVEHIAGDDGEPLPGIIGGSVAMRRLTREVRRVAPLRCSVLVHGESGTGKDLIARALHAESGRGGPLVPINVGAITESLADAELFGHRRGAFTGAIAARPGAFEQAHGGTLFLDEVAELSPSVQVKLLRVVEDGEVRPVGGEPVRVDVRVVAATWASLSDRVRAGTFREDLYHRLSTLTLEVPPLRQRRADIPALARALLSRYREDFGEKQLTSAAFAALQAYGWPGNVRELGSVLYRAALAAEGARIDACHVQAAFPRLAKPKNLALSPGEARSMLEEHGHNVSAAARAARVPRSTFRSWLEKDAAD